MKSELYPNFRERGIENFLPLSFLDKYITLTGGFIAGGCFKNLLSSKEVKDIDIYFENELAFDAAVNRCKNAVRMGTLLDSYENQKVIAFTDVETNIRIELVRSVFGVPEEIINVFDFTVTKFALFKKEGKLIIIHHVDFFEHLSMKRLVIDNLMVLPVSTFERTYKYRDYGYKLCQESKIKLVTALNQMTLTSADLFARSFYDGLD